MKTTVRVVPGYSGFELPGSSHSGDRPHKQPVQWVKTSEGAGFREEPGYLDACGPGYAGFELPYTSPGYFDVGDRCGVGYLTLGSRSKWFLKGTGSRKRGEEGSELYFTCFQRENNKKKGNKEKCKNKRNKE